MGHNGHFYYCTISKKVREDESSRFDLEANVVYKGVYYMATIQGNHNMYRMFISTIQYLVQWKCKWNVLMFWFTWTPLTLLLIELS